MTIRAFGSPVQPLDPRTAAYGTYQAGVNGRTLTVAGPERKYPSGLSYYKVVDASEFIPAGHLDWIAPRRFAAVADIIDFALRRITTVRDCPIGVRTA